MKNAISSIFCLILLASWVPAQVQVLIVDGQNNHSVWPKSTIMMKQYLEETGKKMIILFEGRDASGKGGTIRRVTRYMNEKHYRVVALGKPTDQQKTQWFFQKYVNHLPSGGQVVLFDRSWYNRAMVEPVFGFCTDSEYKNFMLEKYRDQLPEEVFTKQWQPATTIPPHSLRKNLIEARDLLAEAGWTIQDGVLKNEQGEPFILNFLLVQSGFDRIIAPYAHNLKKLGIETNYRKVDTSLYKSRLDNFEFDMVVTSFPSSMSPGNELMNMFSSASAEIKGSNNLPGISSEYST